MQYPVVYDLDENNEAIAAHCFCSETCCDDYLVELTFVGELPKTSIGYGELPTLDTQCERCGNEINS